MKRIEKIYTKSVGQWAACRGSLVIEKQMIMGAPAFPVDISHQNREYDINKELQPHNLKMWLKPVFLFIKFHWLKSTAIKKIMNKEHKIRNEEAERLVSVADLTTSNGFFADDFDADRACPDLSGSEDAVRSEELSADNNEGTGNTEFQQFFKYTAPAKTGAIYQANRKLGLPADNFFNN